MHKFSRLSYKKNYMKIYRDLYILFLVNTKKDSYPIVFNVGF